MAEDQRGAIHQHGAGPEGPAGRAKLVISELAPARDAQQGMFYINDSQEESSRC